MRWGEAVRWQPDIADTIGDLKKANPCLNFTIRPVDVTLDAMVASAANRKVGWRSIVGLSLAAVLLCPACSVMVDTGRQQCTKNEDCTKLGADYAHAVCSAESVCTVPTAWSCLGSVVWPSAGTGKFAATLSLKDIITGGPFSGVAARVCRRLDVTCDQPIATGYVSDNQGKLTIDLPSGFDGYLELQSTDAIPGLYFFNPPLTEAREVPFVPILPLAQITMFGQILGAQLATDRGLMALAAYDCFRAAAGGVSIVSPNADAESTPFYMIKGIPTTKATATDSSGYAGFLNLPPGSVTVSGKLASGATIGTLSVLMRASQMTYTTMLPMPD
jgi:hypothetical protein